MWELTRSQAGSSGYGQESSISSVGRLLSVRLLLFQPGSNEARLIADSPTRA